MVLKPSITFLGIGDVAIDLEQPETAFQHVNGILQAADITYANCEQVLSDKGSPNPKQSIVADPKILSAYLHAGVDIVSLANNHSQDWGKEALLDTMDRLQKAGLPYVGVGNNLDEARQPVILERNNTKVGFLAYCCVGPEGLSYEAQHDFPGYAPVRAITHYEHVDPQPGTWPKIISTPVKEDLANMVEDIRKLKTMVDVAIVCPHWGLHVLPIVIPDYELDIGHAAVDAGADLVIGTHTHLLKGIEMYMGKAIFHSTGDFVFSMRKDVQERHPLLKYSAPRHVTDLKKLYHINDNIWNDDKKKTLIVKALIESGEIKRYSYIPCYQNEQQQPEIVKPDDFRAGKVFDYVQEVTQGADLTTRFTWDGDEVVITP